MLTLQTLNQAARLIRRHFAEIPRFHFHHAHEAALARRPYPLGSVVHATPDGRLGFNRLPHMDEIDAAAVRLRLRPDADPAWRRQWSALAEWTGACVERGCAPGHPARILHQGQVWTMEAWNARKAAFVRDALEHGLLLTRPAFRCLPPPPPGR